MQGQTVSKPNNLVVDVQSSHQPGMVYVMLSRVCSLQQLHILQEMDSDKIRVDEKVLKEAKRMWKVSLNNNPGSWANPKVEGLRVASLNVRSLRKHMEDVRTDPHLKHADILCLQETWLTEEEEEGNRYQLEGYSSSFFLSQGRGKGMAVYVRRGLMIQDVGHHSSTNLQMLKICLGGLDVIPIYRSQEEPFFSVVRHLQNLLDKTTPTLLIGDMNYCFTEQNELSRYLIHLFKMLMTLKTSNPPFQIPDPREV